MWLGSVADDDPSIRVPCMFTVGIGKQDNKLYFIQTGDQGHDPGQHPLRGPEQIERTWKLDRLDIISWQCAMQQCKKEEDSLGPSAS